MARLLHAYLAWRAWHLLPCRAASNNIPLEDLIGDTGPLALILQYHWEPSMVSFKVNYRVGWSYLIMYTTHRLSLVK